MANFIYDNVEYNDKSFSLKIADFMLLPLRVALNGRTITPLNEYKKEYNLALRIFTGIVAAIIFPLTLTAWAIKWWKQGEWQTQSPNICEPTIEEILNTKDLVIIPKERDELINFIAKELASVQHLDLKLGTPEKGWRKWGHDHGETNQSFNEYANCEWLKKTPLVIQRLGVFTEVDLKIIAITVDFLKIFHHVEVGVSENILTMDVLRGKFLKTVKAKFYHDMAKTSFPRKNGQYDTDFALCCLGTLKKEGDKESMLIAFTNEDLFSTDMQNFVFGSANYHGTGIWSNARFGNPQDGDKAFQKCLLRMMKISAHEFGHMRGLHHCTDYKCNIGGYMSLTELDDRPLLYCSQDTAKICYLSQVSMQDYHKKLLNYFTNFNKRYGLNCDLSQDIATLQNRIEALS